MSDSLPWGGIDTIPQNQINWATTTRQPNQELDRQAFLNLLVTQLKYQDPLNPMDDRDFIAQMAQFSALEQMMNLNATFERTQAFGMIGKIVDASFYDPIAEERVEIEQGLVVAVKRQGSTVMIAIETSNGKIVDVPFDSITEVSEDFLLSLQLQAIYSQVQGQRAADLVGKTVQGFAVVGDNLEFVEGVVDSVLIEGDIAVLVIGNQQLVFPRDVFSVSDGGNRIIGSTAFTHGTVTGVEVTSDNKLYLLFDNGTPIESRLFVQKINHIIDALTYVGTRITHADVDNGYVESLTMVAGVPFFDVRVDGETETRRVDFLAYIAERTGQEYESASGDS